MEKKSILMTLIFLLVTLSLIGCSDKEFHPNEYIVGVVGMVPEYEIEIKNDCDWDEISQENKILLIQEGIQECITLANNDITKNDFNAIGKLENGTTIFKWDYKLKNVTVWIKDEKKVINDPLN